MVLAKELATLDALSGGRLTVGVGVGWGEVEYGYLAEGARFHHRGAYLDEAIRLWRHLWSGAAAPFQGRFHRLEDFVSGLLPVHGAAMPIWVGGRSEAAYRRAGALGDGYHSSATGPADYAPRVPLVRRAAEEAGRPMPVLSARVSVQVGTHQGSGYMLAGDPDQLVDDVSAFADLGVEHLAVGFAARDPEEVVAAMERFDRDVVKPVRERRP